ncbi:hypothetical protein, partial [Stutzerimonas balearica]|uniref:hypothetical protein n=1 Tax=Stutzerimonas balearica TaxID=74829 RepID=UPI0028996CEF
MQTHNRFTKRRIERRKTGCNPHQPWAAAQLRSEQAELVAIGWRCDSRRRRRGSGQPLGQAG